MLFKIIIFSLLSILLVPAESSARTVIYACKQGFILGGNNEDWQDPNKKFWFIPEKSGKHGWIKFGFASRYPQEGMDDQGLFS